MNLTRESSSQASGEMTAAVTIVHQNSWDPERHGALFLQPIVEGFLRRRPGTGSPADENSHSPPL